jgi:Zn-dependent peptidase ImmA (M78 family)
MTDEEAREIEANAFAMELLMPEQFVRDEVRKMGGIDICDDAAIAKLAKIFRVPMAAMAVRLGEIRALPKPKQRRSKPRDSET